MSGTGYFSQDKQDSGNSGGSRPGRLRRACNDCNAAKVRCSGERSGCERCTGFGLYCIYEESRVGKVPGVRAKKNRTRSNADSSNTKSHAARANSAQQSDRPEPRSPISQTGGFGTRGDSITVSSAESPMNHRSPLNVDQGSMPMHNMADIFDAQFDLETPVSIGTPRHQIQNSDRSTPLTDSEFLSANLDFDFDSINYSAASTTNTTVEIAQTASPRRQQQQNTPPLSLQSQNAPQNPLEPNLDSQGILACCQIISNLEGYVDARVRVLDLTLTVVKKAVEDLTQVFSLKQEWKAARSNMLFTVIMYQIVQLLEHGCFDFLAESSRPGTMAGKFDNVGGALTGFGFGSMQIDPKEQRAWRAKVVLRELQHVNEIHQRIVYLARIGPLGQTGPDWPSDDPPCHTDLKQRLATICEQFRKVENGWQERSCV